jgi:hypothetical protein
MVELQDNPVIKIYVLSQERHPAGCQVLEEGSSCQFHKYSKLIE